MSRRLLVPMAVAAAAFAGCAPTGSADPSVALDSDEARESYSIGNIIGEQIRQSVDGVDEGAFAAGVVDALAETSRLTPEQMETALAAREQRERQLALEQARILGEKNFAEGKAYRDAFAQEANVVTLDNGLQYKVLAEGGGEKPAPGDTVTVHYRGSFIDGQEFDSSFTRQEPVQIPVDGVIPGWSEALKMMPAGSHWKIVVPPDLAYGEQGAGGLIGPNATLIFEIELVEIG